MHRLPKGPQSCTLLYQVEHRLKLFPLLMSMYPAKAYIRSGCANSQTHGRHSGTDCILLCSWQVKLCTCYALSAWWSIAQSLHDLSALLYLRRHAQLDFPDPIRGAVVTASGLIGIMGLTGCVVSDQVLILFALSIDTQATQPIALGALAFGPPTVAGIGKEPVAQWRGLKVCMAVQATMTSRGKPQPLVIQTSAGMLAFLREQLWTT